MTLMTLNTKILMIDLMYNFTYMFLLMFSLFYDFLVIYICPPNLPLLLARPVVAPGTPVNFDSLLPVRVLTRKLHNKLINVHNNNINIL
jgi:hypothetical protein